MIPNRIFFAKLFAYSDLKYIFAVRKGNAIAQSDIYREVSNGLSFRESKVGAIAQSVEQWTENPCVPGSIPGGTTSLNRKTRKINVLRVFVLKGVTESVMDFATISITLVYEIIFRLCFLSLLMYMRNSNSNIFFL